MDPQKDIPAPVTTENEEILSWPESASLPKMSNTKFATAVAEALCRSELAVQKDFDDRSMSTLPTYAALTKCIHEILEKETDVKDASFSAQGDLWIEKYRIKSGTTTGTVEERYNSLGTVSTGETIQGSPTASDGITWDDGVVTEREATLYHLSIMARPYMKSHPGNDCAASNVAIHNTCRILQNPERWELLANLDVTFLPSMLEYRMNMTKLATAYKRHLKIPYKDCQDIDACAEFCKISRSKDQHFVKRLDEIYELVRKYYEELFEDPTMNQGPPFSQPYQYMVVVLNSTKWTLDEIDAALEELIQVRILALWRRRVASPVRQEARPVIEELVSQTLKGKRLRDTDSDLVLSTPPRKFRVPREHLGAQR